MFRTTRISLSIAIALCGCDVVSSVKDGIAQSTQAATAIEKQVGAKPDVGFNYHNGALTAVTIQFGSVPSMNIVELEKVARAAVVEAFKKEPTKLVVSFVFEKKS